jgi:hypothetical protein
VEVRDGKFSQIVIFIYRRDVALQRLLHIGG